MRKLLYWVKSNSVMLVNAGSLVGSTAVTSVLGFAYWWLAARQFTPETIGLASALISVMMLLGNFCMLGLGTLLITELPRQPGQEVPLISTALIIVGLVGACTGIAFAVVTPYVLADFQPLKASIFTTIIFATGISLTAITLVLDQALIGVLHGGLQLWRNTLFAITKLAVLLLLGLWLSHKTGITIYATWVAGNILSLAILAVYVAFKKKHSGRTYLPQWGLLRKLGSAALQHHLLNLTLQAPSLILPVLVTALLSTRMNAWFYVSWMIAGFVFVVPTALTIVLHATNSAQPSTFGRKARVTIGLAFMTSLLANCVLQFATKQVLGLFGSAYADQATWCLRILALGAFPLIIKNHYISICRIQDRLTSAMLNIIPGGLLELSAVAVGAHLGSLSGLSLGWLAAICIEAAFMSRTVFKALHSIDISSASFAEENEALWLVETAILPSLGSGSAGIDAIWLIETARLPSIKPDSGQNRISEAEKSVQQCKHNSNGRSRLKALRLKQYTPSHTNVQTWDMYLVEHNLDNNETETIHRK